MFKHNTDKETLTNILNCQNMISLTIFGALIHTCECFIQLMSRGSFTFLCLPPKQTKYVCTCTSYENSYKQSSMAQGRFFTDL